MWKNPRLPLSWVVVYLVNDHEVVNVAVCYFKLSFCVNCLFRFSHTNFIKRRQKVIFSLAVNKRFPNIHCSWDCLKLVSSSFRKCPGRQVMRICQKRAYLWWQVHRILLSIDSTKIFMNEIECTSSSIKKECLHKM